MENKDLNVLWRPSSKIKEESNLNQFIKNFVDEFKNQSDVKYEELWKWSIEKPEKFWDSIWDYSNVLGEKGEILLKDKDKMPGARFFPNAKLNYTENVLKNKNEPLAIISEREDGLKSKISTSRAGFFSSLCISTGMPRPLSSTVTEPSGLKVTVTFVQ